MDSAHCAECEAIRSELRAAWLAAKETGEVGSTSPQRLAEWILQLNEDECARMRATSVLWKAWRRLQEHRTLTGHTLALMPLPPNAIANPN
jgi:hypothetical protein